jgi:hypothetical protein
MADIVLTRVEVHPGPVVYVYGRAQVLKFSRVDGGWLVGSPPRGPVYPSLREAIHAAVQSAAWSGVPWATPVLWYRTLRRGSVAEAASTARRLVRRKFGVE